MDNANLLPDFVIGIDFGQTYTGVVWTNLKNNNATQSIRDWPGLPPDSAETKVPTRITRPRDGTDPLWGFLCDADDESREFDEVLEHFKIYLDQDSLNLARRHGVRNMPVTVENAQELVTHYLRQIYQHIKFSIENATGSWQGKRVEFVFSLPTTWESQDTINRFTKAIQDAGFGSGSGSGSESGNNPKHVATLELTEAEAAAVYMSVTQQFPLQEGDIFLICDAGGGTTDLGLIEVSDADPEKPILKQVAAVKGTGIGSTMIDRAFELLVHNRLEQETHSLPEDLAHKLARSASFQSIKHNFGSKVVSHEVYKLPLHKLGLDISRDYSMVSLGIEGGMMQFSRAEIQAFFDTQVRGILGQIKKQLDWMAVNRNEESVKLLVLSGGLGGSQYVLMKIQEYFKATPHSSARQLTVIKSQEPRLVVVKGLVMDRRQKLLLGGAALKTRIARASYGVLCRKPYDPDKYPWHVGADVYIDPLNKKQKFATMQVDWIIKKGDTIETDSAKEREFTRKVIPGDPDRKWDTTIVISHEERDKLPENFKQPAVLKLCQVTSDMKDVADDEFKVKNKRMWQGKKYYDATFVVKVIISPADLKFELWLNGKKYNRGHEPISVEYDTRGAAAKPRRSVDMSDAWEGGVQASKKTRWEALGHI